LKILKLLLNCGKERFRFHLLILAFLACNLPADILYGSPTQRNESHNVVRLILRNPSPFLRKKCFVLLRSFVRNHALITAVKNQANKLALKTHSFGEKGGEHLKANLFGVWGSLFVLTMANKYSVKYSIDIRVKTMLAIKWARQFFEFQTFKTAMLNTRT